MPTYLESKPKGTRPVTKERAIKVLLDEKFDYGRRGRGVTEDLEEDVTDLREMLQLVIESLPEENQQLIIHRLIQMRHGHSKIQLYYGDLDEDS